VGILSILGMGTLGLIFGVVALIFGIIVMIFPAILNMLFATFLLITGLIAIARALGWF